MMNFRNEMESMSDLNNIFILSIPIKSILKRSFTVFLIGSHELIFVIILQIESGTFWEPEEFTVMWREERWLGISKFGFQIKFPFQIKSLWPLSYHYCHNHISMTQICRALLTPGMECTYGSLNTEVILNRDICFLSILLHVVVNLNKNIFSFYSIDIEVIFNNSLREEEQGALLVRLPIDQVTNWQSIRWPTNL